MAENKTCKCTRFDQPQYFFLLFSPSQVKNKILLPHFPVCWLLELTGVLNRIAVGMVDNTV